MKLFREMRREANARVYEAMVKNAISRSPHNAIAELAIKRCFTSGSISGRLRAFDISVTKAILGED